MAWNKEQIMYHVQAARLLDRIMKDTFDHIRDNKKNITEYEVQQHIMELFKEHNLKIDKYKPIVAFQKNSDKIHAIPKKKSSRLRKNNVVMIDIWARLNKRKAPFADITWMGYYGKTSKKVSDVFDAVIKARDRCVNLIKTGMRKGKLPTGNECDSLVKNIIAKGGYEGLMIHNTGHSLGTVSVHGKCNGLRLKNHKKLTRNMGYSVEPGIYLKGRFGMRSELNIYISKNKVMTTTKVQKKLVRI